MLTLCVPQALGDASGDSPRCRGAAHQGELSVPSAGQDGLSSTFHGERGAGQQGRGDITGGPEVTYNFIFIINKTFHANIYSRKYCQAINNPFSYVQVPSSSFN